MSSGFGTLPADVAILVALEEEWEVFWPIAGAPAGVKDDSGGYMYHFAVPGPSRPYRCVALFMGAMGPGQATHATARLLATRPRTLVNLGIAAAIHDDLKLCDVVVVEQVAALPRETVTCRSARGRLLATMGTPDGYRRSLR